jgi:hypothetical protein
VLLSLSKRRAVVALPFTIKMNRKTKNRCYLPTLRLRFVSFKEISTQGE